MNSVFNTTFEISLRTLIMLEIADEQPETADMIAAADFITLYGRDFGISQINLHGDSSYKFSEFAQCRELVNMAVKLLVKKGLINVSLTKNGFSYSINQRGLSYCTRLKSDYADTYRCLAIQTRKYIADRSEARVFTLINRQAISSLQRRKANV
jgi:transposase